MKNITLRFLLLIVALCGSLAAISLTASAQQTNTTTADPYANNPNPGATVFPLAAPLVGIGNAHARHSSMGTGAPHARNFIPVVLRVLHFHPGEIVAGIGHSAISTGVIR